MTLPNVPAPALASPAATNQHVRRITIQTKTNSNQQHLPDLGVKVDAASAQAVVLNHRSHHQRGHAGVCQELVGVPAGLGITYEA
jgi:hypothetical protein